MRRPKQPKSPKRSPPTLGPCGGTLTWQEPDCAPRLKAPPSGPACMLLELDVSMLFFSILVEKTKFKRINVKCFNNNIR